MWGCISCSRLWAPWWLSGLSPSSIAHERRELMTARINYGSLLHLHGNATWQVPLAMQCLPAILLFTGMLFCKESPRWLARTDRWEKSSEVLSHVRKLPASHPYIQAEMLEMRRQLEEELASVNGGTGFMPILREMWTVPGNRRRAILSIVLMICQQVRLSHSFTRASHTDTFHR